MTKTKVIRVFSFIMALTLVFAMASTPAYAIDKRQFGAWIASALTALNITWNSTVAPAIEFIDYLDNPFQIVDNDFNYIPYTHERTDEILNRSTLSISGDTVTIDGIDYTDIWLSHDAANKFRVNAFDIENAWDIASESEGTFVSGAGMFTGANNIPAYLMNGSYRTPNYVLTTPNSYVFGNSTITNGNNTYIYNGNNLVNSWANGTYISDCYLFKTGTNGTRIWTRRKYGGRSWTDSYNADQTQFLNQPFDFDWTAGTIPADPLPVSDGLHLLVPNNPQQWTDDPDTQQVINNIQNFYQLNPDVSPGVDVDLETPGIIDKLDDLLDIISNIIKLTKPSFGPHDSPTPPEPSGDLIPETPWSFLENLLNNIIQKLQHIIDNLLNLPSTIVSAISNLQTSLSNILQDIKDLLSDLVDNIVSGNANWFKDIVDSIWNPFQRIFAVFKAHIGIWHYVVDWLRNISIPFTFFYSVLTGLGSLYTSPIFAAFAGVLVIAIYRRFGR